MEDFILFDDGGGGGGDDSDGGSSMPRTPSSGQATAFKDVDIPTPVTAIFSPRPQAPSTPKFGMEFQAPITPISCTKGSFENCASQPPQRILRFEFEEPGLARAIASLRHAMDRASIVFGAGFNALLRKESSSSLDSLPSTYGIR